MRLKYLDCITPSPVIGDISVMDFALQKSTTAHPRNISSHSQGAPLCWHKGGAAALLAEHDLRYAGSHHRSGRNYFAQQIVASILSAFLYVGCAVWR